MSILFAPGTDYRLVPWSGPTIASGSFTVAMRLYATATTLLSDQQVLNLDTSGGATVVMFIDDNGGAGPRKWAGFVTNDAFTIFAQATDPSTLSLNTWYHVALSWDTTSVRLYINGALVATTTPAATTRTGNWSNWVAPQNFGGAMQDIVAYNAALANEEIAQLYRARVPLRRTNLVMWLPMFIDRGTDNFSGVGSNVVLNGPAPTAGNDSAAVPWGTGITGQPIRLAPVSNGALTAAEVETATMQAAAILTAAGVETAAMGGSAFLNAASALAATMQAGAFITAAEVETALMLGAGVVLTANEIETATMLANAALAANTVSTATMQAAGKLLAAEVETAALSASSNIPAAGGNNGGQGRRFGNRLMPALMRR